MFQNWYRCHGDVSRECSNGAFNKENSMSANTLELILDSFCLAQALYLKIALEHGEVIERSFDSIVSTIRDRIFPEGEHSTTLVAQWLLQASSSDANVGAHRCTSVAKLLAVMFKQFAEFNHKLVN